MAGAGGGDAAAGAAGWFGAAGSTATAGAAGAAGAPVQAPVCGNAELEDGETCDDGNLLSCGTCDSACENVQLAPATGSITAAPRSQLDEADTFTINDGVNSPIVFAFDIDPGGGCTAAGYDVCVNLLTANSADDVALALSDAINDVGATLLITASAPSGSAVNLTHDEDGVQGNQPLGENVAADPFAVEGMAGGLGYDCPAGTGCAVPEDCASGACTAGLCE